MSYKCLLKAFGPSGPNNALLLFNIFKFYVYMCVRVRVCGPCAFRNPWKPLDHLELELKVVVSHDVGAGNRTWVFYRRVLLTTEPSLQLCHKAQAGLKVSPLLGCVWETKARRQFTFQANQGCAGETFSQSRKGQAHQPTPVALGRWRQYSYEFKSRVGQPEPSTIKQPPNTQRKLLPVG